MVNDAADAVADPQLVARRHYQQAPHPLHDHTWVENHNFTLSRTPGRIEWGGPMFGQHNMEVLEGFPRLRRRSHRRSGDRRCHRLSQPEGRRPMTRSMLPLWPTPDNAEPTVIVEGV